MDKQVFDIVKKYSQLVNSLYFKLEELGINNDTIDDLLIDFDDLEEMILKIGKYLDDNKVVNKETYLIKQYKENEKYIRVNVIYEYENDMTLCETTVGTIHLIPKEYLADY
ncbi:hypothetical protein NST17_19500 [Caldifermentibacillus hisashii]|uniref:Uncharacterized protein n=1 Tax=Caldifermentibacillus hisashii TaxID=996558 RepID=A0ABU9K4F9_9BACI